MMQLYTIGFTRKSASEFFGSLRAAGVRLLIDIRLNNTSQLAGFAKHRDLPFFLHELCGARYVHDLRLAPTPELLNDFRGPHGSWPRYATSFMALLHERQIAAQFDRSLLDAPAVLLCSEASAEHCHRRLVADYLARHLGSMEIVHL